MSILEKNHDQPEEIMQELHTAIQNYSITLDKLRLTPGIKNYHKYYQKQLDNRCFLKKEHDLAKTQQLIPPGIGTDHNFNIYNCLSLITQSQTISIPIIDTLLISKRKESIAYLRNNK